jgi:hypothetical protein
VAELFIHFNNANRPPLRIITEMIQQRPGLSGTASKETIRAMLLGIRVPSRWETVEAVFTVLCAAGGTHPDADRWDTGGHYDEVPSYRQALKKAWIEALDAPLTPQPPPSSNETSAPNDPWDLLDEPPF